MGFFDRIFGRRRHQEDRTSTDPSVYATASSSTPHAGASGQGARGGGDEERGERGARDEPREGRGEDPQHEGAREPGDPDDVAGEQQIEVDESSGTEVGDSGGGNGGDGGNGGGGNGGGGNGGGGGE